MDENKQKTIDFLHDHLTNAGWTDLKKESGRLFIKQEPPITIFEEKEGKSTLHFVWRNIRTGEYNLSSGLESMIFDDKTELSEIVYFKSSGIKSIKHY